MSIESKLAELVTGNDSLVRAATVIVTKGSSVLAAANAANQSEYQANLSKSDAAASALQTQAFAVALKSGLAVGGGAALVGFIQSGTGAASRNLQDKAREAVVCPEDFFLAVEADWTGAVQRAINYCQDNHSELRLLGVYNISAELYIRKQIKITGTGAGSGYGETALTGYTQISGFRVTGTGVRRIRTRSLYRASAADPQDAPLSVALNVQAENCVFRDFTVFLNFNPLDLSPTNYGSDWDVGIFVGCRVHQTFDNVHSVGYWRQAAFWFDVTRATALPEFSDPLGVPYNVGTVPNGGDGITMQKCFARGGKWGIRVYGSQPKTSADTFTDPYYDQTLGAAVADARGSFGFSDFTMTACSIYGPDHHSNWRWADPTMNYLTDTAAGAIWISGMNGAGKIQGMRFFSCRFATFEAYRVRLGRCNRVLFLGSHIETRSGSSRKTATGGVLAFTSADTYGYVSMEANTSNMMLLGGAGAITGSGYTAYIDAAATWHDWFSASSVASSRTFHALVAPSFKALSGELDLRSETSTDLVRLRSGSDTLLTVGSGGISFGSSGAISPVISTAAGTLDLRAGADGTVLLRQGNVSVANFASALVDLIAPVQAVSFASRAGALQLSSVAATDSVAFYGGTTLYASMSMSGIAFGAGITSPIISAGAGNLDLRAATGSSLLFRAGSTTLATINATSMVVNSTTTLRPGIANSITLGSATFGWANTYTTVVTFAAGITHSVGAGSPEGVLVASPGSACWDTTNGVQYNKKTGTGSAGWKLVTQAA